MERRDAEFVGEPVAGEVVATTFTTNRGTRWSRRNAITHNDLHTACDRIRTGDVQLGKTVFGLDRLAPNAFVSSIL